MNRPALLLADEPTGALDTASGEDVRQLLTELHADGQTIVLVTHDLALAESCATRTSSWSTAGSPPTPRGAASDERAGPGGALRGGPPPGADGRDRPGRDDRGDRGRARRSLMVASTAPFDRPSPQQHGAHLTAQFDAAKTTAAQLAAPATPPASPRRPARSRPRGHDAPVTAAGLDR